MREIRKLENEEMRKWGNERIKEKSIKKINNLGVSKK